MTKVTCKNQEVDVYYIYNKERRNKMKKYRVYDNSKNELLIESDDMYEIDLFVTLNPSGNLLSFAKENDIFIMWYECYTIYYKGL
jgi:hypothetical protein